MSTDKEGTNLQRRSRNGLTVGLIAGAGLGMVFGSVLFGESRTGFVYGSMLGGVFGLVFSFFFAGRPANKGDANEPNG